jgi:hypothetical protein
MSGIYWRPDVIVVVGHDAHELRTLDQESGVAEKRQADLIRIQRRQTEGVRFDCGKIRRSRAPCCRDHGGALAGNQPGAGLGDFRAGRRWCLREYE